MNALRFFGSASAICLLLLTSCKENNVKNIAAVKSEDEALAALRQVIKSAGGQTIYCPDYFKPDVPGAGKYFCFSSKEKSETILSNISKEMQKIAESKMAWRKDFGMWASSYDLDGDVVNAAISVISVGENPYTRDDKRLTGELAVGTVVYGLKAQE